MVKVSWFIIGTLIGSLAIVLFSLLLADVNEAHSPSTYDNSSLETLNKIQDLKQDSEEIKDATTTIEQDPSILDVIGGFFKSGFSALKTAGKSFSVFNSMAESANDDLPLGDGKKQIYDTLITIVIVLLFIGVFLAAILKWGV
jgi:hypothetical protein